MLSTNYLLLAVALLVTLPLVLSAVHAGVDRLLTRVSIQLFGGYIDQYRSEHPARQQALREAHFPTTYREYGSKTMLYAAVTAVVSAVAGIYVAWAVLYVLAIEPATLEEALPGPLEFLANLGGLEGLSALELFGLFLVACATLGTLAGTFTYWLRWWYPAYVADARARQIEAALPSTIAFVYALSRSGMAFPEVIRIVARHEETYGEAAAEFGVAVNHVDTFGTDVITALQHASRTSPSDQFTDFSENLVSVLQSGHSLSDFLERQYQEFQSEAESQQERILDLLGTLAEAYVTVLVAGPLFLITILVVIGITIGGTAEPLQALIYLILPLGNLVFVVYLSMVTESMVPGSARPSDVDPERPPLDSIARAARTDGGVAAGASAGGDERVRQNVERLRYRSSVDAVRDRLANPWQTLREQPSLTFLVTVPVALAVVGWRAMVATTPAGFDVTMIDDVIALATLFVLVPFVICYELQRRRIEATEAAVPDLLDRLASVNEAGTSVVLAVDHVRGSDLGPLEAELDRVWSDVQWGADLSTAFQRLGTRVRTRAVSRVVTLLTEAMTASGNLATVLRIAGKQAAADRRLKRERAQVMVEYLIVVYISFLVFLFIVSVLVAFMLPNIAGLEEVTGGAEVEALGGVSDAQIETYEVLFYHATLVQGLLSGLIAGQLSSGDVRAGGKHAAAMIALSVLLFAIIV
ncbi:type II secretion system F family protein [Natrarchaeobaculum aegyptiacum]|uniref:type II secretion system F family protein n=1 Tax=Natrarchaeobaculum aegyptiacum TaxID=745377 RepID=UPI0016430FB0|nr:type II secretion system F family protein [Natrarchaeobaculum aegyptiacum]